MALIKNSEAGRVARDALVLDLGDLRRQGDRIVADARAEAERVVEGARREAERIVEAGRDSGYEDGKREGLEEGRKAGLEAGKVEAYEEVSGELKDIAAAWRDGFDRFCDRRERMLREARRDVLELAAAIAERVTKRAVALDEKAAEAQLRAALELVVEPTRLRVHVNPKDHDAMAETLPNLVASLSKSPHAEVVPDESVDRGGCVVRTEAGEIDARVTVQLERIVDALLPDGRRLPERGGGA